MESQKGGKLRVVKQVLEEVRSRQGRFLQQIAKNENPKDELDGKWVEIGDVKAMTKTSQAFRDLRQPPGNIDATSASKATLHSSSKVSNKSSSDEEGSDNNYGDVLKRKTEGNSIAKMIQQHKRKQLQHQRAQLKMTKKKRGKNIAHNQHRILTNQGDAGSSSSSSSSDDSDSSSSDDSSSDSSSDDDSSSSSDEDEDDTANEAVVATRPVSKTKKPKKSKANPQCPSPPSPEYNEEERRIQQEKLEKRRRLIALNQRTSLKSMTGKKPKALVVRKPKKTSVSSASKTKTSTEAKNASSAAKKRKVPKMTVTTVTKTSPATTKATKNAQVPSAKKKRKKAQSASTSSPTSTLIVGSEDNNGNSLSVLLAAVDEKSNEAAKVQKHDDVSDTETEDSFPMYNPS